MEKACNKSNLSQSEIFKEAEKMLKLYNFNYILITMGEKGMILVSKNEKFHVKSTKRINANIVGAGDVVMASVVRFYESFKDMKKAIILSDIAAGIGISKIGTSTASLNEIEKNSKKIAYF
jgi:D-beta-D-heptose 7-phosphate kinase/D-beta-D-heptose 1-phosphate adenosyltransferase